MKADFPCILKELCLLELWHAATLMVNLPLTILLGFVLTYWLFVILGALDMDSLDVDMHVDADMDLDADADLDVHAALDADADVHPDLEGHAEGISAFFIFLNFFNFGRAPFMVVLSVLISVMWMVAMLATHYLSFSSPWLALAFYIPNLIVSLFLTKFLTIPFALAFQHLKKDPLAVESVEAMMCTLLSDTDGQRLAQGEVTVPEGAPYRVNVKSRPGVLLRRGEKVLLIEKNKEKGFYYVESIE